MNSATLASRAHQVERQLDKLQAKTAKVGVIGLGYVGLPLSLLFSEAGVAIQGFDIDTAKVSQLEEGKSYIFRIPPTEIEMARSQGFRATTDFSKISDQDAIIVCVPTPLTEHRDPDLSFIERTAESIAPWLRRGQLVVLESTTYPGTTEEVLIPILNAGSPEGLCAYEEGMDPDGDVFFVAFSPEREDPGNNTVARRDIPKVIGGHGAHSGRLASALYNNIFAKTVSVSSTQAAEMTKLLENIYRCVNIALVNELKILSQKMGIDIWEVIDAAKTKPFGFQAFYPGPGLGGHCIPIDPFYLSWKAREIEMPTRFIELAGEINVAMPRYVVDALARELDRRHGKTLSGARVLILGLAYKKNVPDIRESPTFKLMELLEQRGAKVKYHDPHVPEIPPTREHANYTGRTSVPLSGEVLEGFDVVLISTDHDAVDYVMVHDYAPLIVDTRNVMAKNGLTGKSIVKA
jgi:UDP-N-acetyl-D-glucosamine dehydrogenase